MTAPESAATPQEDHPNVWQRTSEATYTVVTPANIIDAIGFMGAKYGIDRLDTPKGAAITLLSYGADIVDGKVARATGTESKLGEAVDAVGDKIKLAYALFKIRQKDLVYPPLLAAVAAQNAANSALTIIDKRVNGSESVLHSSKLGKRAFFLQELGIGVSIGGSQISSKGLKSGDKIKTIGSIIGFAGFAVGTVATAEYFSKLKQSIQTK